MMTNLLEKIILKFTIRQKCKIKNKNTKNNYRQVCVIFFYVGNVNVILIFSKR